jgi:hypothetical protein
MVAKELPDVDYTSDSDESDGPYGDHRWSCEADDPNPHRAILATLADALVKVGEPVVVHHDDNTAVELNRDFVYWDGRMGSLGSWQVEISSVPEPRAHAPPDYGWIGVRLRSPMVAEETWWEDFSKIKMCLASLRLAARLYVNSSCPFNVLVQPRVDRGQAPLSLNASKRLATLVWLLEDKLIRHLSPPYSGFGVDKFVTLHSRLAKRQLIGTEASRPNVPACANAMDQFVPVLHNDEAQERINIIWGANSLGDLNGLLSDEQGKVLGLSFGDNGDTPTANAQLCYTVWHPYGRFLDYDTFDHWIRLGILLLQWTQVSPYRYHDLIKVPIEAHYGTLRTKSDQYVCSTLMSAIGLDMSTSAPWLLIVGHYKERGRLRPSNIDKFRELPPVEFR